MVENILLVLLALAAAATLFVLARGVIAMARGQDIGGRQSNRYMSLRVIFQFLAVAIVVALFLLTRAGD